jgi:hypothetical protein
MLAKLRPGTPSCRYQNPVPMQRGNSAQPVGHAQDRLLALAHAQERTGQRAVERDCGSVATPDLHGRFRDRQYVQRSAWRRRVFCGGVSIAGTVAARANFGHSAGMPATTPITPVARRKSRREDVRAKFCRVRGLSCGKEPPRAGGLPLESGLAYQESVQSRCAQQVGTVKLLENSARKPEWSRSSEAAFEKAVAVRCGLLHRIGAGRTAAEPQDGWIAKSCASSPSSVPASL